MKITKNIIELSWGLERSYTEFGSPFYTIKGLDGHIEPKDYSMDTWRLIDFADDEVQDGSENAYSVIEDAELVEEFYL